MSETARDYIDRKYGRRPATPQQGEGNSGTGEHEDATPGSGQAPIDDTPTGQEMVSYYLTRKYSGSTPKH